LLILGELTTRGLYLAALPGDFANPKNTQKKWQTFFLIFFVFLLFFNNCSYVTFLQTHLSPKIGDKWKMKYNI